MAVFVVGVTWQFLGLCHWVGIIAVSWSAVQSWCYMAVFLRSWSR